MALGQKGGSKPASQQAGQAQRADAGGSRSRGFSSLPSHEAYVVDVPEVGDLKAAFQYNYFVPDEGSNEAGSVPDRFLRRSGESFDADTLDAIRTRVPRQVNISFTPVVVPGAGRVADARGAGAQVPVAGTTLVADNIDKIVPEDRFTGQRFVSVAFNDARLDDRLFELVSGTYVQHELEEPGDPDASHYRAAMRLGSALGPTVPTGFLTAIMGRATPPGAPRFFGAPLLAGIFRPSAKASMQLNAKVFHDVVARGFKDPDDHFAGDMHGLYQASKRVQRQARLRANPHAVEADYRAYVPYAELSFEAPAHMPVVRPAEVVGYIVDRTETLLGGGSRARDPIVIEGSGVGTTVDLRVRYGASYTYTVRTIARFTVPAVDDETGQVALATVLVSSRPSNSVFVRCTEDEGPPPPTDVGFVWDHETERMTVRWAFPTNPQRDIKRFQVFRRRSVDEPYSLVRMYDFDDSTVPVPMRERPGDHVVERVQDPRAWFTDEEFDRDSRFIYAMGSVDAHGNVSPYSAQHEVSFDRFRNRLVTRLVSHLGAPRQYPNMYIEADSFTDAIRDSGRSRLRVYFTPECYSLRDREGRVEPVISTLQAGGGYRLQFINPDASKMAVVQLSVDDKRTAAAQDSVQVGHLLGG